uniref:Uncharacterized protein n=1 Tax=Pyramimonas obovata TaxID=1411642 RepID=A0A7S0QUR4_9CHLO|mmetsp:Transcript_13129/g.27800  ORF Transcript_13129/g.27800 Transcript_13129/m.27800 type:complete len:753 (+) Transcript_13129:186-2444(+)
MEYEEDLKKDAFILSAMDEEMEREQQGQPNKEEEVQVVRPIRSLGERHRCSLFGCGFSVVLVIIFAAVTIVNLKKLEGIRVITDDLFMDLSKPDIDMKVTFDMRNPSQIHSMRIRSMNCNVLVHSNDNQEKQLLGKLVSDHGLNSKPGGQKILHSTSLVETNAELMADLIAGRSKNDKSEFDCDLDTVVELWSFIPIPKMLHVVTNFGAEKEEATVQKEEDSDFLDELNLSARLVDYGPYFPNIYTAGLQCNTEITFHTGHALKLLFTGLYEHTNTFTLVMPEAGYLLNATFSGSLHDANQTASMDPATDKAVEFKHIKLHLHGARVTKDDVRILDDESKDVVVNMPAKVELACEEADCIRSLSSLSTAYTEAKKSFLSGKEVISDTFAHATRKLLNHDYDYDVNFNEELFGLDILLKINFFSDNGYFGTSILGDIEDLDVGISATGNLGQVAGSSTFYDGYQQPIVNLMLENQDYVAEAMNDGRRGNHTQPRRPPWLPSFQAYRDYGGLYIEDLLELKLKDIGVELWYDGDELYSVDLISQGLQMTFGSLDHVNKHEEHSFLSSPGIPGVAFMTISESFAGLFGVEDAKEFNHVGFAATTSRHIEGGHAPGEEQLNMWMLTTNDYHSGGGIFQNFSTWDADSDEQSNPFFQFSWQRPFGKVGTMSAWMTSAQKYGYMEATVALDGDDNGACRSERSMDVSFNGETTYWNAHEAPTFLYANPPDWLSGSMVAHLFEPEVTQIANHLPGQQHC